MYIPVTYTLWSVLAQLTSNPSPAIFHGLNVILHMINGVQVYYLAKLVIEKFSVQLASTVKWMPVIAALIFISHPLQVEPVMWISASRDLLSVLFALLAIQFYVRSPSITNTVVATAMFMIGILCKPGIIVVPIILFLNDMFLLKCSLRKTSLRLAPMLIISLFAVLIANSIQSDQIEKRLPVVSVGSKLLVTLDSLGFYVSKTLVPVNLSADYARTPASIPNQPDIFVHIALVAVFAFAAVILWRRADTIFRIGLIFFMTALAPMLGLVPFFYQTVSTVADRYAYLPLVGFGIMVSSFCITNTRIVLMAFITLALAVFSTARTSVWKNDRIFFSEILIAQPQSASGHLGLGNYYMSKKDFELAAASFENAIRFDILNSAAYANLLLCLNLQGLHAKVILLANNAFDQERFKIINEGTEGLAAMYSNLGFAYLKNGNAQKSFKFYCIASKHNPNSKDVISGLEKTRILVPNGVCE